MDTTKPQPNHGSDFNNAETWNSETNGADGAWNDTTYSATTTFDTVNADLSDTPGEVENDGVCRRCQNPGHIARDCPEPRTDIACHNCGGPHMKKDCDQPAIKSCRLCKGAHDTIDCKTPYPIDMSNVPDLVEEECWELIKKSSGDHDMDDFKDAMKALQKACPEITYPALEKRLRERAAKFHIIALDKDIGEGYTNVNMQGQAGQKFVVAVYMSASCPRPNLLPKWPKDADENLARLADAGVTMTRGLDHCRRCDKYGHLTKDCTEERVEVEGPKVICALCSEEGHRVRDCTQPRQKERVPITCKRCGTEGHMVKDCDQPEPVKNCRNCGEEGHMSKDCEKTFCRNCDKEGHISKDCTEPKDWSRVVCRHCGEKGHASATRCKPGAQIQTNENADNHHINGNAATDDFVPPSNGNDVFNDNSASAGWSTGEVVAPVGDW